MISSPGADDTAIVPCQASTLYAVFAVTTTVVFIRRLSPDLICLMLATFTFSLGFISFFHILDMSGGVIKGVEVFYI